jgi:micrococcal nuclease
MSVRGILFLILISHACIAQINGRVVSVSDGDTFTLLTNDNEQIRIRLYGIDCPEKDQDFGQVAKKFLSDLVYNKNVNVTKTDVDRYGRTIGKVFIDSVNVNKSLLRAGLAWHYKRYDDDPAWAKVEATARRKKLGLWAKADAVPPWEYRRKH